ncbi:pre-mRNA-processing factor 39 isoform X2 [Episyrphus balteatus]|uniref:pre-mRNA-processing factor 39 isoform X2 n=1 Tax=Episyrphus balteatus TaxID=286459 RepID=UPI0024865672|nr:pre-mRNA-processing factor 39 isoform X2 [Episyrphus balteatus]
MASVNEEENVTHESGKFIRKKLIVKIEKHSINSGRRTRSGRKVIPPSPVTPVTKPRRRTTRKNTQEQVVEPVPEIIEEEEASSYSEQSDIIKEMLAEAAQGVIGDESSRSQPMKSIGEEEDGSEVIHMIEEDGEDVTEIVEEEIVQEEMLHSDLIEEIPEDELIQEDLQTDFIEEEVATEEVDQGSPLQQNDDQVGQEIMTDIVDEELLTETVSENEMDMDQYTAQDGEDVNDTAAADAGGNNVNNVDDEKSSSFPFGNAAQNENSENGPNEVAAGESEETNTNECVESSLLASLAGDNANSLPSVGEEEGENKSFVEKIVVPTPAQIDDEDSISEPAIAEDNTQNNSSDATLINTEMVSEDELPMPTKPEVNDAEEVSDEELPAPQRAELPADTEVVSEDELPANGSIIKKADSPPANKRKANEDKSGEEYNPGSPTGESNDGPVEKKVKVDGEEPKEKKKEKEKKKLPDLEKYWKVVKDDAADFTGWTYLLQYVDQETDVEAAREAYDAFLSHYPYCYGYWRKYADYEKRKGIKANCNEVFERGLKAIPLSVDLWIHYLTHVKANQGDNTEFIRSQFERAIAACGLEFRSDKLWDAYIKWETEGKRFQNVTKIYDRLLAIPTQGYNGHFGNFQDLINNHPATATISVEEFKKLRAEVREALKASKENSKQQHIDNEIPGEGPQDNEPEELADEPDDHVRTAEEMAAIKDKIITIRRKLHKATVSAVTARWTFEEGIKRPYFHVKPLERCQLKNWKDYLDFEIEKGDRKRILILFERCLIACALYDEFWLKLIRYLEGQSDPELIPVTRDAYHRACTIHHTDKPSLHLMWAAFEECQNDFEKAAQILIDLEKICPNLLQIAYRRINVERRRGDFEKCKELYEHYIETAKNKNIAGSLAIKYARFCNKICEDLDGAIKVLQKALEKDPANTRVALQMIDIALQRPKVDENEVVAIMDKFMARENVELEQRVLFAQRKVEFLEDFGSKASGLLDAQRALQVALNKVNEAKKKSENSPNKKSSSSSSKDTGAASNQAQATTAYSNSTNSSAGYNYGSGTNSSYYGQSGQASYPQQQQYDGYYNHWQYGSGYSGYGQWSGYGNYY